MNRSIRLFLVSLIACAAAQAELLVYEPFDYQPHNNEEFGRLEGRKGGIGFASPWEATDGGGNDGSLTGRAHNISNGGDGIGTGDGMVEMLTP